MEKVCHPLFVIGESMTVAVINFNMVVQHILHVLYKIFKINLLKFKKQTIYHFHTYLSSLGIL